jgi:hypothetical protein
MKRQAVNKLILNLMFKFLSLDFYDHQIINWEVKIPFYFHAKPLRTLMNEDLIIAKTFKSNLTPVCRFPKFVHFYIRGILDLI